MPSESLADADSSFQKRSQIIVRAHNEPPSIVTVRVHNPDRLPFKIES
jgi:hypothetical protein